MADRTRKEVVEHLWEKSEQHRGKRLALWVKEGNTRAERAKRAEAAELFMHQHAKESQGQYRRWKMFHDMRVWFGRWAKRIRRTIRRRHRRQQERGKGLGGVDVHPIPGDPHWGGGGCVVAQFVEPFMRNRGLPIGSGKRTPAQNAAVGGSPNSDHLTTHTTTMARDFPTYSGADDAAALANVLGVGFAINSYASGGNFSCDGHGFRCQILWGAAIGHGDHVHVGIGG
jgi:hypothetical protein